MLCDLPMKENPLSHQLAILGIPWKINCSSCEVAGLDHNKQPQQFTIGKNIS
jgi:hypothetical protein